ncbi:MAG TPA: hypothetical protein VF599_10675 [Pyrinomonadaceae bacterium]|jgi:hypothetical protein
MAVKKETGKKGGFSLAPITLSEPVRATDGFTNLVEALPAKEETTELQQKQVSGGTDTTAKKTKAKREVAAINKIAPSASALPGDGEQNERLKKANENQPSKSENQAKNFNLSENELLRILDADSLDEIYELSDVLRASSLKLYAALIRLADARGRARAKNHELMSKAGIKGIATLYKQERWLMDLKLLEKKAKPGPHDGSSYVVHKLETLPLPAEIYEKFDDYLSGLK